jgi:hypothetical protein
MSYERLKMDGWIKSYHRSTVFVCLTGNCIPNRFFTGSSASGRKVQIAPDIWSEIWSGLESDSCALYFTETGWAQGPLQ